MASCVTRIGRYGPRLDRAAESVAGGDTRRFTGVMCESFHDVWMELHEDLIVLQGIERRRRRQLLIRSPPEGEDRPVHPLR